MQGSLLAFIVISTLSLFVENRAARVAASI